jgi:hypothetical protein
MATISNPIVIQGLAGAVMKMPMTLIMRAKWVHLGRVMLGVTSSDRTGSPAPCLTLELRLVKALGVTQGQA